jgi:hypothetical protein
VAWADSVVWSRSVGLPSYEPAAAGHDRSPSIERERHLWDPSAPMALLPGVDMCNHVGGDAEMAGWLGSWAVRVAYAPVLTAACAASQVAVFEQPPPPPPQSSRQRRRLRRRRRRRLSAAALRAAGSAWSCAGSQGGGPVRRGGRRSPSPTATRCAAAAAPEAGRGRGGGGGAGGAGRRRGGGPGLLSPPAQPPLRWRGALAPKVSAARWQQKSVPGGVEVAHHLRAAETPCSRGCACQSSDEFLFLYGFFPRTPDDEVQLRLPPPDPEASPARMVELQARGPCCSDCNLLF